MFLHCVISSFILFSFPFSLSYLSHLLVGLPQRIQSPHARVCTIDRARLDRLSRWYSLSPYIFFLLYKPRVTMSSHKNTLLNILQNPPTYVVRSRILRVCVCVVMYAYYGSRVLANDVHCVMYIMKETRQVSARSCIELPLSLSLSFFLPLLIEIFTDLVFIIPHVTGV